MPLVDLTIPQGTLTPEARATLPLELSKLVLKWEGLPDTEFFRNISWVYLRELPVESVNVAGAPTTQATFRVELIAPVGILTEESKPQLIAEVTETIVEHAGGGDPGAALRVWVLIHEVPEGNWGVAGQVVGAEQLRQLGDAQRETEPAV